MTITPHTFTARRDRLRLSMQEKGVKALLVTHPANRYYLSGFELRNPQCNESSGWLVIFADGGKMLFTDPRYEDEARRHVPESDLMIYSGPKFGMIGGYLKEKNLPCVDFEHRILPCFDHEKLAKYVTLRPSDNLVEDLRLYKDEAEIALMQASCDLNHRIMEAAPDILQPGRTEAEVAWDVEKLFREGGAEGMAFPSIIGVGPNGALPHAIPGETKIEENQLVLLDTGCRLGDYCSDQTRTFWVGDKPSERFTTVRDQVMEAQQEAIKIVRPGLKIAEAYLAARRCFEKYGVEDRFTHALGHGVGLEVHEKPSVSTLTSGELEAGMVITIEPGLYYSDWGGVRWEHMVLVTEDGCRVM